MTRAAAALLCFVFTSCRHAPPIADPYDPNGCDALWSAAGRALADEDTRDPEAFSQARARYLRLEGAYEACAAASPAP